jgi:hypothetical protein
MTLRKVQDYGLFESNIALNYQSPEGNAIVIIPAGPKIKFYLENKGIFEMGIPPYFAAALQYLKEGAVLPKNEFYLVKQLIDRDLDPFTAVKSVNISIKSESATCKVNKISKEQRLSKYGKPIEIISCRGQDFKESCNAVVETDDQASIELDDARASFLAGLMYNVPITINEKKLCDFSIQRSWCDDTDSAIVLNLKDSGDFMPTLASFHEVQIPFISGYNYELKQFTPLKGDPRDSFSSFIYKMNKIYRKNGIKPKVKGVSIDSFLPGTHTYSSNVTVDQNGSMEKYLIMPSSAFLLAKLLGVEVLVDDQLETRMQSQLENKISRDRGIV